MSRALTWIIGPETVLLALTAAIYAFCARHDSGQGRDIELLERLVWLLPILTVPLVYATVWVPGSRTWWWVGRAAVWTLVGIGICAGRVIGGFGDGAKGQDAAFMVAMILGVLLVGLGTSAASAYVWAGQRPVVAAWLRTHWFLGGLAVIGAAIPFGFALGLVVAFVIAILAGILMTLRR